MTRGELLKLLEEEAKRYRLEALLSIKRSRHMNDLSQADLAKLEKNQKQIQRLIDALLVDFINKVGIGQCVDLGLYTKHITSSNRT